MFRELTVATKFPRKGEAMSLTPLSPLPPRKVRLWQIIFALLALNDQ